MTNETTHDDIINKEIEEEHEFMRARIKELENKPTYPFNEAFNKQLQEENEKLKETIRAYQEDRFCQGGCAIYQYDKIHKLTQAIEEKEQECEQKERDIKHLKKCINDSFKIQEDSELHWKKENKTLKQKLEELQQKCDDLTSQLDFAVQQKECLEQEREEQNKVIKAQREENNLNIYKLGVMVKKNDDLYEEKQKYKQALDEIEKLTTIGEVHGLSDIQYVENFRLHQERILNIINKAKEQ